MTPATLVTRNRVLALGLLVGLGGTAVFLGHMWTLSPETIPGSRFELSERDLWQRRAEDLPQVAALVGFPLVGGAASWRWLARRRHLAWAAWPLLVVTGGLGLVLAWAFVDVLTDVPCFEEDDDCGARNAFRIGHPAFYLLPVAALLAAGLWRRRRPAGRRLLVAGCAGVVAILTTLVAYLAVAAWVPPLGDRLRANPCEVGLENNLSACVQTPGYDDGR